MREEAAYPGRQLSIRRKVAEIRTLDEIKTIVEAELRSHAGCSGAGVDLNEVTDRSAPYDWDVQTVNAGPPTYSRRASFASEGSFRDFNSYTAYADPPAVCRAL